MTTNVYLDVDGVLNAVTIKVPSWGWSRESVRRKRINGYMITWSSELVDEINRLAARADVKMHWLTTWTHDAPKMIAPALGLVGGEDWEVLDDDSEHDGWWKLRLIREHSGDTPAIWLDDDIVFDPNATSWVREHWPRILHISPSTRVGLTRRHMNVVHTWLDSGRGQEHDGIGT